MPIVTKQIREGPRFLYRIVAVAERNAEGRLICPTIDFFKNAKSREPIALLKLSERLNLLGEAGSIRDIEKFKHIENWGGLYELRAPHGLRLICFYDIEKTIVCISGEIKKKWKLDPDALKNADLIRKNYLSAKSKGTLRHEPEYI